MPTVCLYLHLHQPFRLRRYSIFDVGNSDQYFTDTQDQNAQIFNKVADKSYLPMLGLLKNLLNWHPDFHFALSLTGVFLEQAEEYRPEIISLLQELVQTKRVELLAETYHHSLASLYDRKEFEEQVTLHRKKLWKLFKYKPKVFRNTELIYSDQIGQMVAEMGYKGLLTEAVDRYLEGPRTQLYSSYTKDRIPLLLKHAHLSDDIAFRFSANHHAGNPLTSETYVHWLNDYKEDEFVNLFMDFETFGEHQWEDTGIFQFFEHMVAQFLRFPWNKFQNPSQIFSKEDAKNLPFYKVPDPISWADIDRDLTAWNGNDLQTDTLRIIYALKEKVLRTHDDELIDQWRKLQASDHFYYMCVKWSADGDVHAYFSPYDSPFDAYNRYTTVLADFRQRVGQFIN